MNHNDYPYRSLVGAVAVVLALQPDGSTAQSADDPEYVRDRTARTNAPGVWQGVKGAITDDAGTPTVRTDAPAYRVNPASVSDGVVRRATPPDPTQRPGPPTRQAQSTPHNYRDVQDRIRIEPDREEYRGSLPSPSDVLRNFQIYFLTDPDASVICDRRKVKLVEVTLAGVHVYNAVQRIATDDSAAADDGMVFLNATVYFNGLIAEDAPTCAGQSYSGETEIVHLLSDIGRVSASGAWYVPAWRRSLTRR